MSRTENAVDPFELSKLYKYLRVVDVADALDGIGYFNIGLMAPEIRPLWLGMKFWGAALTIRCVPANRPMWKLDSTEDIVNAHGIWFKEVGIVGYGDLSSPGTCSSPTPAVAARSASGGRRTRWARSSRARSVSSPTATAATPTRLPLRKRRSARATAGARSSPVASRSSRSRARSHAVESQVRPGDIVGCDDDGVLVVPIEVAQEVAVHARAILLSDMRARRRHYERLGKPMDATVDHEAVEEYYAQFS